MMPTLDFVVTRFFDPSSFDDPLARAKMKLLNDFGRYVRKTAMNSIKTKPHDEHAPAGEIPFGHDRKSKKQYRYKDFIFYFYDKNSDGVIIGAIILPRKDRTKVPGVLEYGGDVEIINKKGQSVVFSQAARPHMQKAFEKAVENFLPELISASIIAV